MKFIKTSLCAAILTAMVSTSSVADCTYELFTISSSQNTKIIDFINQLSDECGFSVIVTDPYAEKYLQKKLNKTNLKNLTVNEVLSIILTDNNLSYTLENNLLKISYLKTKVFNIDYILSQRKSEGSTDVTLSSSSQTQTGDTSNSGSTSNTGNNSNDSSTNGANNSSANSGIKIVSTDEVKFWEQLESEFKSVLNRPTDAYEAPAPLINKNAGLITVTATTQQLHRFQEYLKKLQDKVKLQVLIDVQLLAVTMKRGETTGIDWSQLYALQNIKLGLQNIHSQDVTKYTTEDSTNVNITEHLIRAAGAPLKGAARLVSIKAGGSLSEVIKFLKTQGDVHAISNPKVLTLNNQPALITAGTEYFYKIKSSTNQQGSGGGVAATTQNDTIQSVFAGVLLTITPEISDDDTITLRINPSVSETTTNIEGTSNSGRDMPPDLTRRQLSSVVTVKDGHRIILGGLINTKNTNETSKVPILGDIPIINYLFKHKEVVKETQELVIIIEPHIIHKNTNNLSLSELGYKGLSDDLLQTQKPKSSIVKTVDDNKTNNSKH